MSNCPRSSIFELMPELPEVETIVRGLRDCVLNKTICEVTVLHEKPLAKWSTPDFKNFFRQETIAKIERRGKYILFIFKSNKRLVVHLRMTGKFIYKQAAPSPEFNHIRLIFSFTDNSTLYYQDLRIFGTFAPFKPLEEITEFKALGPDPFSKTLNPSRLIAILKRNTIPVKNVLLDQHVISGLGNIYACEALFKAKINPLQAANSLNPAQVTTLLKSIRAILRLAIKYNGTTVNDFRSVDNKSGRFQEFLKVYKKQGELCHRCEKAEIIRIKQKQRSTFYCPFCQKSNS